VREAGKPKEGGGMNYAQHLLSAEIEHCEKRLAARHDELSATERKLAELRNECDVLEQNIYEMHETLKELRS
jgi:predicted ribosome quality control (RQC) complex YloA/Tae2 family protein